MTAYGKVGSMRGSTLVLLAGGASVRFGSDKLAARLGEHDLLSLTLSRLPPGLPVIVVGPARTPAARTPPAPGAGAGASRPARAVTWVLESPAGSGPARAVHAGVLAARAVAPSLPVVVLPADAPEAHLAVAPLLVALATLPAGAAGVVGRDASGGPQPLHLALTPAGADALAQDPPGPGSSARVLVASLGLVPVLLPAASTRDVDTRADLEAYRTRPCGDRPDPPPAQ